jgi:NTE family protein
MASRSIAVVLAGAVAQGAFEAGVIRALAEAEVEIVRIVAASAGALNAVVLARAVCDGDLLAGAATLEDLWRNHAGWREVFRVDLRHLLRRDGVSDQDGLLNLLREHVTPVDLAAPGEVRLRLIVAPLAGRDGKIGDDDATTFEAQVDFDETAFGSRDGLERVFRVATASAAFPIVFAPVELEDLGPCVDGGAVNNTPLRSALDPAMGPAVDAVVVIATSVEHRTVAPGDLHGLGLVGHLAEVLIGERLYRDLREAAQVNAGLRGLAHQLASGSLTAKQHADVLDAIGWAGRRAVELVRIRPTVQLEGNAFSGFVDDTLRGAQYDAGRERGRAVLRGLGWLP